MEDSGLTKEDIDRIRTVFANYKPVEKALLYGSRAIGNYKPASDIDIALVGNSIDLSLQTRIAFDLDDLLLPYKFDISVYGRITNAALIAHINRVGKELYRCSDYEQNAHKNSVIFHK